MTLKTPEPVIGAAIGSDFGPTIHAVVLAAGKGKRLSMPWPKVLSPLWGQTLLDYVFDSIADFSSQQRVSLSLSLVVGHQSELVMKDVKEKYQSSMGSKLHFVQQDQQLGTGHALQCFIEESMGRIKDEDVVLVICGDTPLIRSSHILELYNEFKKQLNLDAVAATFQIDNPKGYGRIIRDPNNLGFEIREEKDANLEEKKINEVNAGLYIIKTKFLREKLKLLKNSNNSQEYYLTDIFTTTSAVKNVLFYQDAISFLGVNDQEQLEIVSTEMKRRKIQDLRQIDKVFIPDSSQIHIDWRVKVGEGTILYSGTHLLGKTVIGKNCQIGPQVYLQNTILEDSVTILPFSSLEKAYCASYVSVGPFARLRPESRLEESVKIGNFVEVKKSHLKKGVKVSHLSYVGDATIGQNSNIGCGFITCNYDGKNKHQTIIGSNTFIGSDCQAIAPITIGDGSFVAAGTTITENVPSKAFAIGRSKQLTREGYAERFLKHDPNANISQK